MRYLEYLVGLVKGGDRPYNKLFSTLYSSIFLWDDKTPLDKDRCLDGIELRSNYYQETGLEPECPYNSRTASILEVLIALSFSIDKIMSEYGDEKPDFWFGLMLNNLGLSQFDDEHFDENQVRDILENWREKRYKPNGEGGLFPLRNPSRDQRKVAIWDQCNEYLNENY